VSIDFYRFIDNVLKFNIALSNGFPILITWGVNRTWKWTWSVNVWYLILARILVFFFSEIGRAYIAVVVYLYLKRSPAKHVFSSFSWQKFYAQLNNLKCAYLRSCYFQLFLLNFFNYEKNACCCGFICFIVNLAQNYLKALFVKKINRLSPNLRPF